MDAQRLLALSRLSRCARCARRIQRQIHVQPIRLARRFLRHVAQPYPAHLSQFLSARKTLAVYRNQARTRSTVNRQSAITGCTPNDNAIMTGETRTATPPVSQLPSASSDFLVDVIAGLS